MSQYAYLSKSDLTWAQAAAGMPLPIVPIDFVQFRQGTPAFRKSLEEKQGPAITSGLTVSEKRIPVQDGTISIQTYVPQPDQELGERENQTYPVLVWNYGGGFCLGELDADDRLLRSCTVELRISCVSIDYRKAPEHPFPIGLNDSYTALKWVASNTTELRADLTKGFVLGGQSSGANFAAVLTQRALDDPELKGKLTGQALLVPVLIHPKAYPDKFKGELLSWEQNKDAPVLPAFFLQFLLDAYSPTDVSSPEMSPLLKPSLKGLPPTYFQIAGLDPLRDEAFLYDRLLREAEVSTKVDVYPGLPHGFQVFFPELEVSRKMVNDTKEGLRWLFERSSGR